MFVSLLGQVCRQESDRCRTRSPSRLFFCNEGIANSYVCPGARSEEQQDDATMENYAARASFSAVRRRQRVSQPMRQGPNTLLEFANHSAIIVTRQNLIDALRLAVLSEWRTIDPVGKEVS